nr:MAG TPA: hypothetical protein [Caudoviricetes sp.]
MLFVGCLSQRIILDLCIADVSIIHLYVLDV